MADPSATNRGLVATSIDEFATLVSFSDAIQLKKCKARKQAANKANKKAWARPCCHGRISSRRPVTPPTMRLANPIRHAAIETDGTSSNQRMKRAAELRASTATTSIVTTTHPRGRSARCVMAWRGS